MTHEFLRWLWPAVAAALAGVATLVIAASAIWPKAREFGEAAFVWIATMMKTPWPYMAFVVLFLAWLAALVWSGRKLDQIEKMREIGPFVPDEDGYIILDGGNAKGELER